MSIYGRGAGGATGGSRISVSRGGLFLRPIPGGGDLSHGHGTPVDTSVGTPSESNPGRESVSSRLGKPLLIPVASVAASGKGTAYIQTIECVLTHVILYHLDRFDHPIRASAFGCCVAGATRTAIGIARRTW